MKLKLEAPPALSVSRATFARALSHVLLPAAAVAFAADAPAEPQRVLDLESYLRDAQRERLERILRTLETDTGYKLRVATQSRATAPGLKSLRAQWAADDRTVIVIADAGIPGSLEAGNPFLRFDVGDEASFVMPPIFFSRLTREFGKAPFVSDASKYGASIVASCEIILTCLRQEEFCVDVPAARTYPLFE